jgi:DNA-binding SARP family transcriptional activator/tetratricopeptide (TPR) repeat protein
MAGSDVRRGPLAVDLLGPVRARAGEDELPLGPARQRAVFAVLAARAGEEVSRRELIDAVWGESAPASADGSVYTYMSGLRRCLAPVGEPVEKGPGGYRLRLQPGALDVAEFERLCRSGEEAAESGAHRAAADAYTAALDLWRGEPFSGIPGPFAEQERERLLQRRIDVHERRAAALLELGEHADVAAELSALVADHPLRESLRALLMLALYRSERQAEALEVFHDARRVLQEELGVRPGPALQELNDRMLAGDPTLTAPPQTPPHPVPGPQRAHESSSLYGRDDELSLLRSRVDALVAGRGHSVWVEGAAGIGKSELLITALAGVEERGCRLSWAAADELAQRFPLQVILDCLGIDVRSPDPRRAALARQLQGTPSDPVTDGADPVLAAVDSLLSLVDTLCAEAPQVLVLDDMQWADEASVLVWHRLSAASRQLPLLLIGAARPAPNRPELVQLRQRVSARGHTTLTLAPLNSEASRDLVAAQVRARPGRGLLDLAARAEGNPLYLREMVDGLLRGGAIEVVDGVAEVDQPAYEPPTSLIAAMGRTLEGVSERTRDALRMAALLGPEFTVDDVAAVTRRTPAELVGVFEEAVAANILVDAGLQLRFRHPLLRQALYADIPAAMRSALHRQAAEALAAGGAPVRRVAEQLIAAPKAIDTWVGEWLVAHSAELATGAPHIAVDLLQRVVDIPTLAARHRELLSAALARVLFRMARDPEATLQRIRQAIELSSEPARTAELRQLYAAMLHRSGQTSLAQEVIAESMADPKLPDIWRSRHMALLVNFRRGDLSDIDAAEADARAACATAERTGDAYLLAHAHQTLWQICSMRRDHEAALQHVDRALAVVRDRPDLADIHFDLLDNRMFTLQNLDRLPEARAALRSAREITVQHALPSGLQVSAAVHYYWEGRWDEAMAELETVIEDGPEISFYGLREPGPAALLLHGVAALIAGHRDDRGRAADHLDAAAVHAPETRSERESFDFLLVAQALAAEQAGEPQRALAILSPILNVGYAQMMLRHQWLPGIARLARRIGDEEAARAALAACEYEADREKVPARAHAALQWCRALIDRDVAAGKAVVAHHRAAGRQVELAWALEDLAEIHAETGRPDDAGRCLSEAVEIYGDLSARWDRHRAQQRLAAYGVHAETAAPTRAGWESLSAVERRIAELVSRGKANPEIAAELLLPRRTVQAHVVRILRTLRLESRAALAEQFARLRQADRDVPGRVGQMTSARRA